MSLFQCENCGCVENTALCSYWSRSFFKDDRKLCSSCAPSHHNNGEKNSKGGGWHNQFDRVFLPKGKFRTNEAGNLEHIETGSESYEKYTIDPSI